MTLRLLCLWVPFFLVGGAAGVDLRYGTYGRLAGPELPWRDGWCGAALIVEGADVVTVGALDVTTGGPYAHLQAEVLKILLHWTPLVDWRDQIPPRRWYSPYHLLLDRLGVPAGLRSRQSVLEAQIKAEEPVLEALGKQARATDTSTIPRLAPPPANVRQSGTPLTDEECQRRGGELVDLGNLHFYPWIYADSASRTGEPLGTHFRRQFQRLGSLSRWVADHCTSHQVWLTETGNLNPLSDEELARWFMNPMLDGLERLGAWNGGVGITRWHWFMAAGEDSKFKSVQDVKPYFPVLNVLVWPTAILLGIDPQDLQTTLGIMKCLERQTPTQGLRHPDGRSRLIEAIYLRRSGRMTTP